LRCVIIGEAVKEKQKDKREIVNKNEKQKLNLKDENE